MDSISKTIWSDSDDETLAKTAKQELWSDCDEEALVTVAVASDTTACEKTDNAIYVAERIKEDTEDEKSEWSDSDSDCLDIMRRNQHLSSIDILADDIWKDTPEIRFKGCKCYSTCTVKRKGNANRN